MQLYQLDTPQPIVQFCKIGDENKRYLKRTSHQKTDIIFAIDKDGVLTEYLTYRHFQNQRRTKILFPFKKNYKAYRYQEM